MAYPYPHPYLYLLSLSLSLPCPYPYPYSFLFLPYSYPDPYPDSFPFAKPCRNLAGHSLNGELSSASEWGQIGMGRLSRLQLGENQFSGALPALSLPALQGL